MSDNEEKPQKTSYNLRSTAQQPARGKATTRVSKREFDKLTEKTGGAGNSATGPLRSTSEVNLTTSPDAKKTKSESDLTESTKERHVEFADKDKQKSRLAREVLEAFKEGFVGLKALTSPKKQKEKDTKLLILPKPILKIPGRTPSTSSRPTSTSSSTSDVTDYISAESDQETSNEEKQSNSGTTTPESVIEKTLSTASNNTPVTGSRSRTTSSSSQEEHQQCTGNSPTILEAQQEFDNLYEDLQNRLALTVTTPSKTKVPVSKEAATGKETCRLQETTLHLASPRENKTTTGTEENGQEQKRKVSKHTSLIHYSGGFSAIGTGRSESTHLVDLARVVGYSASEDFASGNLWENLDQAPGIRRNQTSVWPDYYSSESDLRATNVSNITHRWKLFSDPPTRNWTSNVWKDYYTEPTERQSALQHLLLNQEETERYSRTQQQQQLQQQVLKRQQRERFANEISNINQNDTLESGETTEVEDGEFCIDDETYCKKLFTPRSHNQRTLIKNLASNEDSVDDSEMAYTTPITFRGTSQEDAEGWLRHATWWLNTTRAGTSGSVTQRLHQLAVLFQDEAQTWFAGLGPEGECRELTSWEAFCAAFLKRFKRDAVDRTGDVAALIQTRQGLNQTVEEFVMAIRKQGSIIGASQDEMYMAVVAGLAPHLKGQIMQHDPVNLEQVVRRGKVAERYPISSPPMAMAQQKHAVSQEGLDKILTAINELGSRPSLGADRARSTTPPRVRFNDTTDRARSPERRPAIWTGDIREPRSTGWSDNRMTRYQSPSRYNSQINQNHERWQTSSSRGRPFEQGRNGGAFRERWNNQPRQQGEGFRRPSYGENGGKCGNCGKDHTREQRCPAKGTTCGNCGKQNHWRICCRGGRGTGRGYPPPLSNQRALPAPGSRD